MKEGLLKAIQKRYGGKLTIRSLNDGAGCNVRIPTGSVFMVWFKKRKFNHNINSKWICFEGSAQLYAAIDEALNPTPKQPEKVTQVKQDAGTQVCIDHIKRKIEILKSFEPTTMNNAKGALMINLVEELKQYL